MAVGARSEASSANTINGDQSSNDAPQAGAVYVFTRGTNGWTQEAYVKAFNADARDEFGRSVALFGDTLAVGAMFEDGSAVGVNPPDPAINDNNTVDSGAVYLFSRDSTGWTPTAYVKSLHPGPNDYLGDGGALGLWGDTLVVGGATEMGTTGAAYVFQ